MNEIFPKIDYMFYSNVTTHNQTLGLFQHKRFLENGSFFKEHFLENCIIFQCLVTTLKINLRMFSGVWYANFYSYFLYFLCNLKHVYYVNQLM